MLDDTAEMPSPTASPPQLPMDVFEELHIVPDSRNIYHQTVERVLAAAHTVGLKHHQQIIIAQPKNEIIVHFPVLMDNGHHELLKGYRVQHNNALGPYKGGIRYHPRASLDLVKSMAVLMTMKCALTRVPLGGGAGAVKCNPRELSEDECMRVTRRFCSAISNQIGPEYDILAPDIGTNSQTMAWLVDTYQQMLPEHSRQDAKKVATAKPLELGGSIGRDKACGQGLVNVLREILPDFSMDISQMSYSLLGFGNVGGWTARLLEQLGARLVAVCDETGAICNPKGISARRLAQHVSETGGVAGFDQSDSISALEFCSYPVDLFIPAAVEQLITENEASRIDARLVVEGGNAPVTPEGEAILLQRGIEILPDILCGAGGAVVSYFEWIQNKSGVFWTADDVDAQLESLMIAATRRVRLARVKYECDLRTAANCAALEQIGRIYDLRGLFP